MSPPIYSYMMDGTYFLREEWVLTHDSGGDPNHTVTWSPASQSQKAVFFSGGRPTQGWKRVGDNVFQFVADNVTFPQSLIRNLWVWNNATSPSTWERRQLSALPVAQYLSASVNAADNASTLNLRAGTLNVTADQLLYANVVCWRRNGATTITPVTGYNASFLTTTAPPFAPSFDKLDTRFYVLNVDDASALTPGAFIFNPETRVVTYRAKPGEDPTAATLIVAPALHTTLSTNANITWPSQNVHVVNMTFGEWTCTHRVMLSMA